MLLFVFIVNFHQVSDLAGNERLQDCLLQVTNNSFHPLHVSSLFSFTFFPVCLLLQCIGRPGSSGQVDEGAQMSSNVFYYRMFSSLQEEMTSRVREGRRRKKAKNSDYEDELNSGDCEVFQCGAASLGHMAYRSQDNLCITFKLLIRMYRGVSSLMELGNRGKEN